MTTHLLRLALPCALALALCSACQTAAGVGAPAPVAFATLAQAQGGELDAAPQGVIRTASGLGRLWTKLPADTAPAPAIDFEREMVVWATRGTIERVVEEAGFLRVEVRARTAGFHMVRLPLSDAPVQFVTAR